MKKVAITGVLSCGKSSVCRFLQNLGAHVVSADAIVHNLYHENEEVKQKLVHLFGEDIKVSGEIDRRRIAEKVFQQPEQLKKLEEMIHPHVNRAIEAQYRQLQQNPSNTAILFVAEIPLLLEATPEEVRQYDAVVVVTSDKEACLQRFQAKTGQGEDEYKRRMQRQLTQEEKAARADYIIDNRGSLAELEQAATDLYKELTHGASKN